MISHCGMSLAAASANFCSSTTVRAKLPQASTPRCCRRATASISAKSASVRPDVPTTTCAPRSSAARMLALALSGFVYSTNTSHGIGERLRGRRVDGAAKARLAQHLPEASPRVPARDRGDERQVLGLRNRARQLGARPARRTRKTDVDRHESGSDPPRGVEPIRPRMVETKDIARRIHETRLPPQPGLVARILRELQPLGLELGNGSVERRALEIDDGPAKARRAPSSWWIENVASPTVDLKRA